MPQRHRCISMSSWILKPYDACGYSEGIYDPNKTNLQIFKSSSLNILFTFLILNSLPHQFSPYQFILFTLLHRPLAIPYFLFSRFLLLSQAHYIFLSKFDSGSSKFVAHRTNLAGGNYISSALGSDRSPLFV